MYQGYAMQSTQYSVAHLSPTVYGRDPSMLRSCTHGKANLPVVYQQLKDHDEFLAEIKD
jgi:hypothetical protein